MTFQEALSLPLTQQLVTTALYVAAILVLRQVWATAVRRNQKIVPDLKRRWLVQLRNGAVFLILAGAVVIWGRELRPVAVSFLAFGVAMVLAFKELILCLTGSILRGAGQSFHIGDRIEVAGYRGDVFDLGALTTTILEIGPDQLTHQLTGRAVVLPNSLFLNTPVVNETFTHDYVLHVFKVPIKREPGWERAEEILLAAACREFEAFQEEARRHFERLGRREGIVVFSVDPRVTVNMVDADVMELVVRLAVPARQKGRIEQAILRSFLKEMPGAMAPGGSA